MGEPLIDEALQACALAGRFGHGDIEKVAEHISCFGHYRPGQAASEEHSLQGGTSAWDGFGARGKEAAR